MDDEEASGRVAAGDEARRLSRHARREQVLDAALPVVARHGQATTTDQVARAAGVSQPYVVRMFGSKAELLLALLERTGERVVDAFRAVPAGPGAAEAMGEAYVRLVSDRDLLLVLLHGFGAADPLIAACARRVLDQTAQVFRERTGGSADEVRDFLAHGMLINVLLAVGAWEHRDEHPDLAAVAIGLVAAEDVPLPTPAAATATVPAGQR